MYVLTLYIGLGAMTSGALDVTNSNMAAPLLARSFSEWLFAVISAIAFTTVLGTVSGLIIAASGAVAHDLAGSVFQLQMTDLSELLHGESSTGDCVLSYIVLGIAFVLGLELGQRSGKAFSRGDTTHWSQVVSAQQAEIAEMKNALQERVDALSMRMGEVNGRMIRLDALGKRLTEMANIDSREFNFDAAPPAGGPEDGEGGVAAQIPDLTNLLTDLEERVDLRGAQLVALENVLIARQLREQIRCGLVIITGRGDAVDKVVGLEIGADDYVTKPFGTEELLARIRVALRRVETSAAPSGPIVCGDLQIDRDRFRVLRAGEELRLTPKEFELLTFMAQHPGRVLTHRQLLRAIWGPHAADQPEHLRVLVASLRKKIEPNPSQPKYILTEPWVGYRFADV